MNSLAVAAVFFGAWIIAALGAGRSIRDIRKS